VPIWRLDTPRSHRGLSLQLARRDNAAANSIVPVFSAASMGEKIQHRMTKSRMPRQSAEFPNMAKKF